MTTQAPPPTSFPGPRSTDPARPPRRSARRRRAAVLVGVAILAALVRVAVPGTDLGPRALVAGMFGAPGSTADAAAGAPGDLATGGEDPREQDDQIDPFDDDHPAIAGLEDDLRAALQAAARDAQAAGVDFWVTSGWRSAAYQQLLLDRAVERHGSLAEARRFAKTPETSEHVSGRAVDIGPTDGADWTIRKGARYGLCQTYANEMWHFELATSPGGVCPQPLPDAAG
ncbi:M15 family metallopeptidase [Cellulomonas sp. P22]|uniref:M15 family metallopeptidase n=1 Tax=Cellulomonas sp. P22 TaxID=3373189 RepID=UPI0037B5CE19